MQAHRVTTQSQSELVELPHHDFALDPDSPRNEKRENDSDAKHRVVMDALGEEDMSSSNSVHTDDEMREEEGPNSITHLSAVPNMSEGKLKPVLSQNLANMSRELQAKKKTIQVPSATLRVHPSKQYIIDPAKYTYFRGYLRQDWHTIKHELGGEIEELRATWLELFFDLIFVATIVRISQEVADTKDPILFILPFFQFLVLYMCWGDTVQFRTRFSARQNIDKFFEFLFMLGVLLMGLSISTGQPIKKSSSSKTTTSDKGKARALAADFGQLFFLFYLITRIALFGLYWKASLIPRAQLFCRLFMGIMVGEFIISLVVGVTANSVETQMVGVLCLILFIHFAPELIIRWPDKKARLPINVPHVAERLGLFVMLVMGEAIISLVTGKIELAVYAYATVGASFLALFLMQGLYFDSQPPEETIINDSKGHAMRKSKLRGKTFWVMHYFVILGLLAYGVGNKIVLKNFLIPPYYPKLLDVLLTGYSLVFLSVVINIIRVTHPFKVRHKKTWIIRIGTIIFMAALPPFFLLGKSAVSSVIIVGLGVLSLIVLAAVDEESKMVRAIEKEHEQHKIHEAEEKEREKEMREKEKNKSSGSHQQNIVEMSKTQSTTTGNYTTTADDEDSDGIYY